LSPDLILLFVISLVAEYFDSRIVLSDPIDEKAMSRMKNIKKSILGAALALAMLHVSTPAMAMSPCQTSSCALAPMALIYGIPVSIGGALTGTFLIPAIANNIADQDIAYWKLSLANFVVSTATAALVTFGTLEQFSEDQAGGYVVTCFLAPVAASALTSWAMHTFMDKEPGGLANAPVNALIPSVAMAMTPQYQGVLLGWQL
jgi:hypothetical protein